MPVHNGPRATYNPHTDTWEPLVQGPKWFGDAVWRWRHRDVKFGHIVRREYGGWVIRPGRGLRRLRWVTPPVAFTRAIPATDQDAATDWAMDRMAKS